MAEETQAPTATTVEASPIEEDATIPLEEPAPNNLTDAPKEEEEATEAVAASPSEETEITPSALDNKRKLGDLEGEDEKSKGEADLETGEKKDETEAEISEPADVSDAKRQRVDDGGVDVLDGGQDVQKEEGSPAVNGQVPYTKKVESGPIDETVKNSTEAISQQDNLPSEGQQEASRKIEIPNNKVGVLIGKAGETIRSLQTNSGARIQITRDFEADPNSSTRPVELTGTLESINKAEQLIKDVIAEADAGGSPALVARGFGATQSGSEVHEMQVPNEKVGMIIGKGGENIKSLQTKSQARIQLIPQHLPEGDFSKERTVRITGNKKHIEAAKSMIKDIMNQPPGRSSNFSAGHTQGYRPRGPVNQLQWGPRALSPVQSQMQPGSGYDYPQRGTYPPQTTQYPQQSYGSGYPQQPHPRNNLSAGWEQRPAAPVQTPAGYDYYGQGQAISMGTQPSNPASAPTSAPVNYNYGQPQAAGYGQSNPYSQSGPPQQGYGHGYNEPKYDNQAPGQQMYGQQQQPVSSQPGFYPQQGSTTPQSGYAQQPPYNKPATYAGGPQSYGAPRATQTGDQMYQGPVPSTYGSSGPTQQSYPYGSRPPLPLLLALPPPPPPPLPPLRRPPHLLLPLLPLPRRRRGVSPRPRPPPLPPRLGRRPLPQRHSRLLPRHRHRHILRLVPHLPLPPRRPRPQGPRRAAGGGRRAGRAPRGTHPQLGGDRPRDAAGGERVQPAAGGRRPALVHRRDPGAVRGGAAEVRGERGGHVRGGDGAREGGEPDGGGHGRGLGEREGEPGVAEGGDGGGPPARGKMGKGSEGEVRGVLEEEEGEAREEGEEGRDAGSVLRWAWCPHVLELTRAARS